jgi:hypothetical protein
MCVFCAPFASWMKLRGTPVSVPGLARRAVPLTPSIAASLSWPSCRAEHAFSAKIAHAGRTNPLPVRYCFKSFSCNTYKKQGVGSPIPDSSLITRHCSQVICFQTLAHSFALFCIGAKLNPFLSNRFRTLCPKYGGGVCLTSLPPYFITSRNGNALPAAMGAAAKRAHRLQERRSCPALNQLSGGGGGGAASGPPLNF